MLNGDPFHSLFYEFAYSIVCYKDNKGSHGLTHMHHKVIFPPVLYRVCILQIFP